MSEDTTATAAPWYDTLDTETKGYVQNKGLDKKTPLEAFAEVSKFHREAEKMIGVPADQLLRLPKDPNAPEWETVRQRLGKPKEAAEYDLSVVKRAGDKPVDDALATTIKNALFNGNVAKDAAPRVASEIVKHLDAQETAALAERTARLAEEKKILETNWGANAPANMVVARAAVAALGIKPEAVAALEQTVGYAQVMEMFRQIGSKIGEDRFVQSAGGAAGNVMTRDAAVAEKAELMRDVAWRDRYLAGGREERRKMDALERIIVGVS